MELELKVLTIIQQERPLENMLVNFLPCDTIAIAELRRKKRTINLPQDFVPSIQGDYDKLELPEFVAVFLFIIKSYDSFFFFFFFYYSITNTHNYLQCT